jgi:protocatechuate 3,4-dioxygenase beta subunit
MKFAFLFIAQVVFSLAGCAQQSPPDPKRVGGRCEGCEAIFESPVPFSRLTHVDTLPDFNEAGPKMIVSGTVYQNDGKTPAKDVVIYIYHTNQLGVYPQKGGEKGWAVRHGYIRGWAKTNATGEYRFYTLRPGAYPGRQNPEHIHITIKEPDKNEYYIDEFHFEDDPILANSGMHFENRGGNGIMKVERKNNLQYVKRDIVLGLHIPGYR